MDKKDLRSYKRRPAYPSSLNIGAPVGLELSVKMMAALVSNPNTFGNPMTVPQDRARLYPHIAETAVALADALIVAYLKSLRDDG